MRSVPKTLRVAPLPSSAHASEPVTVKCAWRGCGANAAYRVRVLLRDAKGGRVADLDSTVMLCPQCKLTATFDDLVEGPTFAKIASSLAAKGYGNPIRSQCELEMVPVN